MSVPVHGSPEFEFHAGENLIFFFFKRFFFTGVFGQFMRITTNLQAHLFFYLFFTVFFSELIHFFWVFFYNRGVPISLCAQLFFPKLNSDFHYSLQFENVFSPSFLLLFIFLIAFLLILLGVEI